MSGPRAYVEPSALEADPVTLTGDGFHHVRRVLRLGPGDGLELFDGAGGAARATIVEAGDRALTLRVEQRSRRERPEGPRVTLLCGELKGDKLDLVLQKATELGVDRFVPVTASRSVVRPTGEARKRRHARHRKVAREACRQCGRAFLPDVEPSQPLAEALAAHGGGDGYVLWESSAAAGLAAALAETPDPRDRCLLVGPEGGFTPEEVASASAQGFREVTLGPLILRADTAALAAITLTCAHLGRLG